MYVMYVCVCVHIYIYIYIYENITYQVRFLVELLLSKGSVMGFDCGADPAKWDALMATLRQRGIKRDVGLEELLVCVHVCFVYVYMYVYVY